MKITLRVIQHRPPPHNGSPRRKRLAWKIRKDVSSDSALGQVLWMEVSEAVRGLRGVTVI